MVSPLSDPADSSPQAPSKTWRAGTLSYTTTGLILLFVWLLWGDFAWSMKEKSVPPIVQLLLKKFHSSDTLTGIIIGSLPAALGMMVGPIVSYKSDRHRGRWGRRIPFLLIPTPIAVLGMVSLALSPQIGEAVHHALGPYSPGPNHCILIFFGISWTLFELASLVANSVYGGLINDVVPQEVLGRFYGAFRALSLVAGMIFYLWVIGLAETYYVSIFLGLGALYGVGFSLMCLKVREGEYPATVPMDVGRDTKGFFHAAKTYFQESFSHPYYRLYYLALGISWQAFTPVNLFSVFYAQEIQLGVDAFGKCVALTYLISLGLSYPLGMLVDRFHPLRITLVVMGLYALVTLLGGLFIQGPLTFAMAWVAHGVLSGTWFTAVASVGQRLLPKEEFAQFFSAAGMVQSLCAIFVGTVTGVLLDHLHQVYRYTFFFSFGIAVVSLILGYLLNLKFMALGGLKNYAAPEGLPRGPLQNSS